MVRTVLKDGVFVPVEPLPAGWREGAAFRVEADDEPPDDPEEMRRILGELEARRRGVDEADWKVMQDAIDAVRRDAKEAVRREWGLPPS